MENWQAVYFNQNFRFLDHTHLAELNGFTYDALLSFAVDDCLALGVSSESAPSVMRLWTHDKTIVLGIADSRLPHIKEGIQFLENAGYRVIVRNSGGLAVVLDQNVLNISLILPNMRSLSINDGYLAMKGFVTEIFKPFTNSIEAYEIIGSYCPGDYDLSIGGRKFAGISQRRVRDGVAVQIYLDVQGNSAERASIIRDFYNISTLNASIKSLPTIILPEKMASLSELLGVEFSVEDVIKRVKELLEKLVEEVSFHPELTEVERSHLKTRYDQMIKRNHVIMD